MEESVSSLMACRGGRSETCICAPPSGHQWPEGSEIGALALSQGLAVAYHVLTFITGWIGIFEALIEGSKLPNQLESHRVVCACHWHISESSKSYGSTGI
jgi:hypothetical protein